MPHPSFNLPFPGRALLAGGALLLAACSAYSTGEPEQYCTAELRPGIVVEIRDAESGAPLAHAAAGEVRDGDYVDELKPGMFENYAFETMYARVAAHERPGIYSVEVRRAGYQTWTASGVRVEDAPCHAQTVTLQARLVPLSN
jgi:hypothetical protein